jgi:hypothetical protein
MGTNGVAAGVGAFRSKRVRRLAAVVLAGLWLLPGCSGWGFFLEPPPLFIGIETWTDVPAGKTEVTAKAGDVLHFPLGPGAVGARHKLPIQFDVTVNGEHPADPQYLVTLAAVTFVFRAQQPGEYHIVVTRFGPGEELPPLVWDVSVSE